MAEKPKLMATSDSTAVRGRVARINVSGDTEALMSGWVYYDGRWTCADCRGPLGG